LYLEDTREEIRNKCGTIPKIRLVKSLRHARVEFMGLVNPQTKIILRLSGDFQTGFRPSDRRQYSGTLLWYLQVKAKAIPVQV
jgi:hypothetical protein